MKTILNELLFDTEMVRTLKLKELDNEFLYAQLMTGRITLREYLELTK